MEPYIGAKLQLKPFQMSPKRRLSENLTSVESVEKFGYKKVTFAEKLFKSCVYVFVSKNTFKCLGEIFWRHGLRSTPPHLMRV